MAEEKPVTIKWEEKCAKSNGTSYLLPKELADQASEFDKKQAEINDFTKETYEKINKMQRELDAMTVPFWFRVRQYIEENGSKDVYSMTLGFDADAAKDGLRVVNLTAPRPNNQFGS